MKSLWLTLVTLLAVVIFHTANAEESAPQEPPYTQENEFENSSPVSQEFEDTIQIEDEIKQSRQSEAPGNVPSAEAGKKEQTVDLNKSVPESGQQTEDELLKAEQEESVAMPQEEPAVIPTEEAPIEIKPEPKIQYSDVVRQSPKGGVEYIHHPQAAKGLLRIEKDGTYVYRTKEDTSYKTTGSFRIGAMDAPKITSSDGSTDFEMMYKGPTVPMLSFDYEWQPWESLHNVAIQAGLGVMTANGNGRFTKTAPSGNPTAGEKAQEQYTILAIPLNVGLSYRFQYVDRQWFAPYLAGGGTYIPVVEYRDDGASTNAVGTPGAYGAVGGLLNISAMDRSTAFTLKNEYGIANLWVSLEYRYLKSFTQEVDFSSSIVGAGIAVDY
ncbi:MAG: hypothetical protein ACM3MG_07175 [Bacillota bacterium]